MSSLLEALKNSGLVKPQVVVEPVDHLKDALDILKSGKLVSISSTELFNNLKYNFGDEAEGLLVSGDTSWMPAATFRKIFDKAIEMGFPVEAVKLRENNQAIFLRIYFNDPCENNRAIFDIDNSPEAPLMRRAVSDYAKITSL